MISAGQTSTKGLWKVMNWVESVQSQGVALLTAQAAQTLLGYLIRQTPTKRGREGRDREKGFGGDCEIEELWRGVLCRNATQQKSQGSKRKRE